VRKTTEVRGVGYYAGEREGSREPLSKRKAVWGRREVKGDLNGRIQTPVK